MTHVIECKRGITEQHDPIYVIFNKCHGGMSGRRFTQQLYFTLFFVYFNIYNEHGFLTEYSSFQNKEQMW